jgi:ElaB/YqjD/DUF883 family membrane-anchored ribosome-binding protein
MATTDKTSPDAPAVKAVKTTTKAKAPAKKAASATPKTPAKRAAAPKAATPSKVAAIRQEADGVLTKVKSSAIDAANSGKDKASTALDEVSSMVEDVARTLDDKVGAQYGDYARKAADALTGVADSLKSKEVNELLDDARNFVRRKPTIAIGAAAALGFALTRLFKADDDAA